MELRSGQVVGGHMLPPQARPAFEEGARLLFRRWTALALAVENQWGGSGSTEKANWMVQEAINWFDRNKDHYWDELEEELEDAMVQDFNVEVEDGSPGEIAKALVSLHEECSREDYSTVLRLRAQAGRATAGAAASQRQVVDRDGTVMGEGSDSSSDEDGSGDDDMQQAPQGVPLQPQPPAPPPGPEVDEDGFTLVPAKGKRGGRR